MMTQVQAKADKEQPRVMVSEVGANYSVQSMVTGFISGADNPTPISTQTDSQATPKREPLKHLLIGSSKAVTSTIHYLQVIGYAQVGDWSPLLPSPNPGEVMSILNRPIVVQ